MNFYMKQEEKSPRESGGPVRREGEPAIVASPRVSRAARRSVLGRNNIITQSHDARRGEGRSLRAPDSPLTQTYKQTASKPKHTDALGNSLPGHKTRSGGLITAPGLMTPAPVL